jgi:hypothetical protein
MWLSWNSAIHDRSKRFVLVAVLVSLSLATRSNSTTFLQGRCEDTRWICQPWIRDLTANSNDVMVCRIVFFPQTSFHRYIARVLCTAAHLKTSQSSSRMAVQRWRGQHQALLPSTARPAKRRDRLFTTQDLAPEVTFSRSRPKERSGSSEHTQIPFGSFRRVFQASCFPQVYCSCFGLNVTDPNGMLVFRTRG